MTVVGDAMARPLAAAIERGTADVSSLSVVANGGALLTPTTKQRLIEAVPGLIVVDGVGSSETGAQMSHMSAPGAVSTGTFNAGPDTCVVADDFSTVPPPGPRRDRLAGAARIPCRWATRATQPRRRRPSRSSMACDMRCPVTGRAISSDGSVELLGRDSVTINSGGEKIFAEEVELALASHPAVADVVVTGRPSERWGQEVVAVVALADDAGADADELIAHAATSLARYKLPKAVVFRPVIERSPAGKADYRWAREQAVNDA